jgi:hypothetical protein
MAESLTIVDLLNEVAETHHVSADSWPEFYERGLRARFPS